MQCNLSKANTYEKNICVWEVFNEDMLQLKLPFGYLLIHKLAKIAKNDIYATHTESIEKHSDWKILWRNYLDNI